MVYLSVNTILLALGRMLTGVLYVRGGISHFFEVAPVAAQMGERGVPWPRATLIAGSLFETAAGLLFMSGYYTAFAACCLIVFTVLATLMFLSFWHMQGQARATAKNACMLNLALIGGLLIAVALT